MNVESLREHCISKEGITESFPFGENILVFKVLGKIFALTDLSHPDSVNLKCDPEYAISLRERFAEIQPGYHMNKRHWNTVQFTGSLDDGLIFELVDHSYEQVLRSQSKAKQKAITTK